jgi:hypothetical protein
MKRKNKNMSCNSLTVRLASGSGGAHNLSDLDAERASVSGEEVTTKVLLPRRGATRYKSV